MITYGGQLLIVTVVHARCYKVEPVRLGTRGRAKVLLSHREGPFFLGDQALVRDCRPDGGRLL